MNYNELAKAIHENAKLHGWWDEERGYGDIAALISSELSEALEEYRDGRPNVWFACVPTDVFAGCKNMTHCKSSKGKLGCIKADSDCQYKDKKPEGVAVELADVMIRILDYAAHEDMDIDNGINDVAERCSRFIGKDSRLGNVITTANKWLTESYEYEDAYDKEDVELNFKYVLVLLDGCIKCMGEDAEQLIKLKHEYNRGRAYRHGGKKL